MMSSIRPRQRSTIRQLRPRTQVLIRLGQLATIGLFLLAWDVAGRSRPLTLSDPGAVMRELGRWLQGTNGRWTDVAVTSKEALFGFVLAATAGVMLAAIVVASDSLLRFVMPFVGALNALPKIALAPLFVVLFGIDMRSKVYFVAAVLLFIPFFSLVSAARGLDQHLIQNVEMLGGARRHVIRHVHVPSMLTALITSLRLIAAWSLLAAIISEFIVSREGIGHVIKEGQQVLRNDIVLGGVLLVATVAFVVDRLLVWLERLLVRWRPS